MQFEAVIGLEVHAQLLTRSKIFCGCSTAYGDPANSHTCPVCLGMPGALPVLNREAVSMAVRAGLALGCRINPASIMARKNYFYPDLPKGYQISQYDRPLAEKGSVRVWSTAESSQSSNGREYKSFGVTRVHLEEDAGKSVHSPDGGSYVNLNRSGVPLIEIVSEPDFRSSTEAYEYVSHIRRTLMYLDLCDGNMEEGSLRCDANVSVRSKGEVGLGTKVEIKNLNSFRFLKKALDYEIDRQSEIVRNGEKVWQETRQWNDEKGRTRPLRSKEEEQDYRYFPDPDLLPVQVDSSWLDALASSIPELPEPKRSRIAESYRLGDEEAYAVCQSRPFADFFEAAVKLGAGPRSVYNWMIGELTRRLKTDEIQIQDCTLQPQGLSRMIRLIDEGAISGKIAKEVFEAMYESGDDPEKIIAREGWRQISDVDRLKEMAERLIDANPDKVEAYRKGKRGLLAFFVGQVMQETRGQANPELINRILQEKLEADS